MLNTANIIPQILWTILFSLKMSQHNSSESMVIIAELIKRGIKVSSTALTPDSALFCAIHKIFTKNQEIERKTKLNRYFVPMDVALKTFFMFRGVN